MTEYIHTIAGNDTWKKEPTLHKILCANKQIDVHTHTHNRKMGRFWSGQKDARKFKVAFQIFDSDSIAQKKPHEKPWMMLIWCNEMSYRFALQANVTCSIKRRMRGRQTDRLELLCQYMLCVCESKCRTPNSSIRRIRIVHFEGIDWRRKKQQQTNRTLRILYTLSVFSVGNKSHSNRFNVWVRLFSGWFCTKSNDHLHDIDKYGFIPYIISVVWVNVVKSICHG